MNNNGHILPEVHRQGYCVRIGKRLTFKKTLAFFIFGRYNNKRKGKVHFVLELLPQNVDSVVYLCFHETVTKPRRSICLRCSSLLCIVYMRVVSMLL